MDVNGQDNYNVHGEIHLLQKYVSVERNSVSPQSLRICPVLSILNPTQSVDNATNITLSKVANQLSSIGKDTKGSPCLPEHNTPHGKQRRSTNANCVCILEKIPHSESSQLSRTQVHRVRGQMEKERQRWRWRWRRSALTQSVSPCVLFFLSVTVCDCVLLAVGRMNEVKNTGLHSLNI